MESKEGRKHQSTSTSEPELPCLKPESEHLIGVGKSIQSSPCQTPLPIALQSGHSEEVFSLPTGSKPQSSVEFTTRATQTLQPGCRRVRSKSLQNIHTPKKIVRFADSLGLDLTEIKRFREGKEPKVPVSAFADLKLDSKPCPLSVVTSISSTGSINHGVATKVTKLVFVPQFHEPRSDPFFKTRLSEWKVCLEGLIVGQYEVEGLIRTSNLGFEKHVQVRYTTDNWMTHADVDAEYMPGSSTGDSDKFTFNLQLPPLRMGEKLVFGIRYRVNGQEYWDNNYNENYVIKCVVQEA